MTVTQANMFMNTKQFYRSKFLQLALPTQVLQSQRNKSKRKVILFC